MSFRLEKVILQGEDYRVSEAAAGRETNPKNTLAMRSRGNDHPRSASLRVATPVIALVEWVISTTLAVHDPAFFPQRKPPYGAALYH